MDITPRSLALFLEYAEDAVNWGGTPLLGGNVEHVAEDQGNLTQLKRAGLLKTSEDDGDVWIHFTLMGYGLAAKHGVFIMD